MRRNRKKAAAPNRFESDVFHDCGAVITASVSELTLRPGKSTTIALTCSGNLPKSYLFWAQLQPDITLEFGQPLDNGRRILATITGTKPSEGYARIYLGSDAKTFEEAVLYAYADVYVVVRGAHTQSSGTYAFDSAEISYDEEERQVTLSGALSRSTLQCARQCMRAHGSNGLLIHTTGVLSREIMMQIGSISNLDRLTIVGADDNTRIEDLTPLTSLRTLRDLNLPNVHLTDISPFADMSQLSSLKLAMNEIVDLTPLRRLQRLTCLSISGNQVSDLTPLSNLTNLTSLDFNSCKNVSSLLPLSGLTNLKYLHISYMNVKRLHGLENARNLIVLNACGCNMADTSALEVSGCRAALKQ